MSADFTHVAIIGVGVIGGSLGLSLKRKHPEMRILGVSRPQTLDEALELGAIDRGFTREEMGEAAAQSDLVFVCAPISNILELLPALSEAVRPKTLVSDVGSTKRLIVETAAGYFRGDKYFVGGHPMAGNEGRGVSWADPLLFENAVYVLTPASGVPGDITNRFGQLLESIGAKVLLLDPATHDRIAAAVSHLPQILAVTLMNYVASLQKDSATCLRLAAGGFRDMTRIASSPFDMWRDVFSTNREEIGTRIDGFIDALKTMKSGLVSEEMEEIFRLSAAGRLSIPRDTKGFMRPNFDMTVQVEDKPGVIAAISTVLAGESINIKDIEVLKVREGDSGMIRLAFESEAERLRAKELLSRTGYHGQIKK
ncbi:MAG TPA: prephenate dehydrogenase [bacterium]|nr:prephenate dehydrogenase [bacterium]